MRRGGKGAWSDCRGRWESEMISVGPDAGIGPGLSGTCRESLRRRFVARAEFDPLTLPPGPRLIDDGG